MDKNKGVMFNFFRSWRLRWQVVSLEKEKEESLRRLGKKAYELFIERKDWGKEELRENCQEVLSIEEEIEDLEEKMRRLEGNKPRRVCPSCGEYIEEGSLYCSHCGFYQKQELTCSQCGEKINSQDRFCPRCGQEVKKASPDKIEEEEKNDRKIHPSRDEKNLE